MDMPRFTTTINVRYAETDKMGVAHHSSYLLWYELARTGLLREAGFAYRDLEAAGTLLPVVEYRCRFVKGADYDDDVRIETTITELRSRMIRFRYRAYRNDDLLSEGWTRHICVNGKNTPRRLDTELVAALQKYLESADSPAEI
jgi:acyl-CoA thioester hydrolase